MGENADQTEQRDVQNTRGRSQSPDGNAIEYRRKT